MHRHATISLTPDERIILAVWARRTLTLFVATVATAFALSSLTPNEGLSANAQTQEPSLRPLCTLWDQQASDAISRHVQDSKTDVDLRQLGDVIFRMRRARRNCEQGWVRTACQDYHAILRNVPGTSANWPGSASVCPLAMSNESIVSKSPIR